MSQSKRSFGRLWPLLVLGVVLIVMSVGCSVGQLLTGRAASGEGITKTPRPTFTPPPGQEAFVSPVEPGGLGVQPPGVTAVVPGQAVVRGTLPPGVSSDPFSSPLGQPTGSTNLVLFATNTPDPRTPQATPEPTSNVTPTPSVQPTATPYVVVNADTLNGRRGPGTTFEVAGQAKQGQTLILLGRNAEGDWWNVCCVANQPVWVFGELVTANGAFESVPVVTPRPTLVPSPAPPPTLTPLPSPTPMPPFDIAAGPLFPIRRDSGLMTIWVKVFEGPPDNQQPLPGYVLKVFRDDIDVSLPDQSYANLGGFDFTAETEGNLPYNLKFEMYEAGEARWQIYLARPDGSRVSPVTEYTTLGDAYRNQVVYIAYWLAR